MRRIRYQVACSLDGYIAGPKGEFEWIVSDPEIDFDAIFDQFDTMLMGRRTYEDLPGGAEAYAGMETLVFSRTLRPEDHPDVTVVARTSRRRWRRSARDRARTSGCSAGASSSEACWSWASWTRWSRR